MANNEIFKCKVAPAKKDSSTKNLIQMQTQIESMLKDILPKDEETAQNKSENSFGDELSESDKSIDFNEFSDELFNQPCESRDDSMLTSSQMPQFNRNPHYELKSQTMKTKNSLFTKNAKMFNFDYNQQFSQFNPNRNIKKNFKTQIYECYNPKNIIPLYQYQNPFFPSNSSNTNTTFTSQNTNLSMLSSNSICDVIPQKTQRNCFIKKTYNNQVYNNNFRIDLINRTKKNNFSSKKVNPNSNQYQSNTTKRFHTMKPYHKTTNLPFEIEILLNELEIALNRTGFIHFSIFTSIKPQLLTLIKTQMGSRILQNYLQKTPSAILNLLFEEIYEHINVLLLDPYANYFCLKLFCYLGQQERLAYLSLITKNIVTFSVNKIATYPIQCIIGSLVTNAEKELLMEHIDKNIKKLSLDIYGTHVIEKIIMCLEPEYCRNIIKFILDNYTFLANHVNGLCLAKKILMLQYKKENFSILKQILIDHCLELIENPYGNYALQIVIDYWEHNDVIEIISQLLGHCTELSMMKYSSNVIERCLQKSEVFLEKFITETCFTSNTVGALIKNNYGNYVIQTALKTARNGMKIALINAIENNLNILGEKKLINKWKSILASNIIECVNTGSNISNIE